jgi:glycosyltransferase involved in cell wall biosynthesis
MTLEARQPVKQSTPDAELAAFGTAERDAAAAFFAEHAAGAGAPVAVVIPAYNEEPTVAQVLAEIPAELAGLPAEAIVVVDGSEDATAEQAAGAGALVCDVKAHVGQGVVLRLGYLLARARGAQFIATIDADGQYVAAELERLLEPLATGRADFVNGSRRLGTELTTDPMRHAGVIFFGGLVSLLVRQRITDPACGIRAFRSEVTSAVTLTQQQYQTSELLIGTAMAGFRVMEVATTMRDRPPGATGTKKGPNLLYGVRFARAVLGTWRRERKAKMERNAGRSRLRSEKIQKL